MTRAPARWAVEGAAPRWPRPLSFGHRALPPRPSLDARLRDLFVRQWYTNQGPLAREFEAALAARLGVRHALAVTNEMIAALMAAEACERPGLRVGVSALAPPHLVQALAWAGWLPCLLDVDPVDGEVPAEAWARKDLAAAVDADPFGRGRGLPEVLADRAAAGMPVLADRSRGGAWPMAAVPGVTHILSLHEDQVLSAQEGGCIALDDDALAARLRNIRSSYGAGAPVAVVKTSNGRLSEAQALFGLLSLESLDERVARNRACTARLREALAPVPGLRWIGGDPAGSEAQQWLLAVDAGAFGLTAAQLRTLLRAEGLPARGLAGPQGHRAVVGAGADDCPRAAAFAGACLQLPHPADLSDAEVDGIAVMLAAAQADAARLRTCLEGVRCG